MIADSEILAVNEITAYVDDDDAEEERDLFILFCLEKQHCS